MIGGSASSFATAHAWSTPTGTWSGNAWARHVPVTQILAEIREHGYTGSANLLVRYINQGRADPERATPSPCRLVSWIMSKPADLPDHTPPPPP